MDVVIKKEKADDNFNGRSGSWLDSPIDIRACEWCSAPNYMKNELPQYANKPLEEWHPDLLLDLWFCFDCVIEYHKLQDDLPAECKKLLHYKDIERLSKTITKALGEGTELQESALRCLQVPLLEILKFPYFLHDDRLAGLFKQGLIALNKYRCPLKLDELEEKLPGTYLLLVHPDPEVRGWAVRSVRSQGQIKRDDYDTLKEVIGWLIKVVEFNLFENAELLAPESKPFEITYLPSHLFMPLTIREYWLGLFVLLRQMDVETLQSCFICFSEHLEFFNIVVSSMDHQESIEDEGAFWPRLQCFVVLLERLGNRIWQISLQYKPNQLFRIITTNNVFHNAIRQWQNNEFEVTGFSQDVFGDLRATRKLSSSSDTKYSSRFYKTALAWFQPFVQSLLDFESHEGCLSHVIEYLHNLAEGCLPESTFKLDVQSALLRIIHELLARRMSKLLEPTVSIWAVDVLDTVIFEFGEKKMVDITRRLLQNLLKACHRLGNKNALKFWDKFTLPGAKVLSIEERQNILSILVHTFKAQHDPAFQAVRTSSSSNVPTVQSSGSARVPSVQSIGQSTEAVTAQSFGRTKAATLTGQSFGRTQESSLQSSGSNKVPKVGSSGLSTKAVTQSFVIPTVQSVGQSTKAATVQSSASTKAQTPLSFVSSKVPTVKSTAQSFGSAKAVSVQSSGQSTKAITVQSTGGTRAPAAQASGSSKAPVVNPKHVAKSERQKTKRETDAKPLRQASIQIQGIRPLKEIKSSEGGSGFGRKSMENSDTSHIKNYEALAKPGPSSYVSSSEGEEEGFWNNRKRKKKTKHSPGFGTKVPRVESSGQSTKASTAQSKPQLSHSFGNVKVSQRSLKLNGSPIHAKVELTDCRTPERKIKIEKGVQNVAIQSTARPKKTHKAKKSAGKTKKHKPISQTSGATLDDPIVLSDDEESATEPTQQKEPITAGNKEVGFLDDYFNRGSSETDDATLNQAIDEYESPENAAKTFSATKDTTANKSLTKDDSSSALEINSSDEELLHSVMECKDGDLQSANPSSEYKISSKVKAEKTDFNTDEGDVVHSDYSSSSAALLDTNGRLKSPPGTKPFPVIQRTSAATSSVKRDYSDDSDSSDDDKPLASRFKTAIALKPKDASFNKVTSATASDTSAHERDLPEIKSKVEGNACSFAEVDDDIQGEVDNFMDGSCDDWEDENKSGAIEEDAEPTLPTMKTEPVVQKEETTSLAIISEHVFNDVETDPVVQKEGTTSLAMISEQVFNDAIIDDGTSFWDGYSELVLNSQENALATVEEDLDDLYSTQPDNWEENTDVLPTSDEVNQTAKVTKHVSFVSDSPSADAVASTSRSSVSQAAITQPKRALSEDDFLREILNWKTESLHNVHSNGRAANLPRNYLANPVPNSFESIDQYYDTFKPLLFMEIWEEAVSSWWDKDVSRKHVSMSVLDGSTVNSFWIIPCSGVINEHQQRKAFFPLESDLVLLTLASGDATGGNNGQSFSGRAAFGFVEKIEVKQVQPPRRVSIGSGDDESNEKTFQLKLDIKTTPNFRPVRNCRIHVEFVTSLLTALRNWSGLMHLSKSILASDILRPRKTDYFCSNDYSHSPHVAKEYNESQEKIISTAANAVHKPFPIPRICLVQGPPGTGKSCTIVGLLQEILNRAQEIPAQTSTGPSSGSLANKVRILLCAPSNAAIDELIGRIKDAHIQLDRRQDNKENRRHNRQDAVKEAFSTNSGDLRVVRVGRKSHIHPSVMKFSLDSITKQVLEKASASMPADELNKIKEKLKNIHNDEKRLEHEIWKLKTSPRPHQEELQKKETQKANLIAQKRSVEMRCRAEKAKQANKRREEARIRRDILNRADVICTTLSGAGSGSLKQDLAGRLVCPFTCVIVDEACQSNELDLLIPLCFQASKLVLVGDPEQLPSTVLSVKAKEKLFGRSMFERLYRFFRHQKDMEKPVLMLEEQYRMHPEIAAFPSQHVYNNYLKSHKSLEKRPFPLVKHYAVFDVVHGREKSQDKGALWNPTEVELIVNLCGDLTKILHVDSIGIITPYRKHKNEIQNRLKEKNLSIGDATIEVHTVDGFQGREKDVIILSCVRAQTYRGSIGFLSDRQRMNVSLTRARHALYVFGHMETLKGGSLDWKALVEDAEKRGCLFPVKSPGEVRSLLSIGSTSNNNTQSPAKDPRLINRHFSMSDSYNGSLNDRPVDQMDMPRDIPTHERRQPVEGKVHLSAAVASHTPPLVRTNSKSSEPLPSYQRVGHAAESRGKVVNSVHSDKHQQVKHGRDHYHKERSEVPRHRPRSADHHRHDDRHQEKRDIEKNDRNRKDGDRHGTSKESNHTHREHSRHHHRDHDHGRDRERERDYHRNRDRECDREHRDYRDRDKCSAFQGRQMEPGQRKRKPEANARYAYAPTTSTLDKNVASYAEEMPHESAIRTDTQGVCLQSVLENNATHKQEYFLQLHRQEQQYARVRASPSDTCWSPADTEPDVTSTGISARVSQPTPSNFSSAAPGSSTSRSKRPHTPLQSAHAASVSPRETGWSPPEDEWSPAEVEMSPVEVDVTRSPSPVGTTRPQSSTSFFSTAFRPSSSKTSHSRVETDVSRASNPVGSTRPSPPSRPFSTTSRPSSSKTTHSRVETDVSRASKPVGSTRQSPPSRLFSTTSRPSSSKTTHLRVETDMSRASNPESSTRLPPTSSSSSTAFKPSTSHTIHPSASVHKTHGATASFSGVSSRPTISHLSNHLEGNPPLDRRSSSTGLTPDAQRALEKVKQRHPPVQGPPVISVPSGSRNPFGGSRKRVAHASTTDVSSLRQKGTREVGSPPKRLASNPMRRNSLKKKIGKTTFHGRKNWDKDGR